MINRHWLAASAVAFSLTLAPAVEAKAKTHAAPAISAPTMLAPAKPEAAGFAGDRLTHLDDAMRGAVEHGEVAGMVTMLVRHGKVVDFNAYGKKNAAAGTAMTKDSIFRIYSQSKPVTSVAMMILFEEGKWRLDDPVSKYIPEFANLRVMASVDKKGEPVLEDLNRPPTMRELMTHTAGFGYGLRQNNPVDKAFADQKVLSSNGLHEMVTKIAGIPLLAQPGTKWSYSAAVDIQGYIIEKLSGMTLAQFMESPIFNPLGMSDTGFVVPAKSADRFATAYFLPAPGATLIEVPVGGLMQDFTKEPNLYSGGGGLVSTASDYAKFCQMLLNHGELNGARILAPATVALMQANHLAPGVTSEPFVKGGSVIGSNGLGFGLDFAVFTDAAKAGSLAGTGSFFWGGAAGTWFWIDPKNDLFFLGMIQRFDNNPAGEGFSGLSQTLVYQALVHPEK